MKRLLTIIGLLLLAFSVTAVSVLAAEEDDDMRVFAPVIDEYKCAISLGEEVLNNIDAFTYVGGLGFGGYRPGEDTVYAFCDVNQDGTNEMLISTGNGSNSRSIIELFYAKDGEVYKLFGDTFNYRVSLHIGSDNSFMLSGSNGVGCESLTIYYSGSELPLLEKVESFYYDNSELDRDLPDSIRLSEAEYKNKLNSYIMNGLDYTAMDWHFFVIPEAGEYDPYPLKDLSGVDGLYQEANYGSMFIFYRDEGKFSLAVDLLEAFGSVSGTYFEDDSGIICCEVESANFSGWDGYSYDDTIGMKIYLRAEDESIHLLQNIWEPDYNNNPYQFVQSISITYDSGAATVTGDGVRIRGGPGTDFPIVSMLSIGETVTITGRSGDWYRIEYTHYSSSDPYSNDSVPYTAVGFMSADYISKN